MKLDLKPNPGLPLHCENQFLLGTKYLENLLIKKTLLRKLNFTLNIKATETCLLSTLRKKRFFEKYLERN